MSDRRLQYKSKGRKVNDMEKEFNTIEAAYYAVNHDHNLNAIVISDMGWRSEIYYNSWKRKIEKRLFKPNGDEVC